MDQLKHSQSKIDGNVDFIKKLLQEGKIRKKENGTNHEESSTNGEDKYFMLPDDEKERHSSGESVDSFYSESSPPESDSESRNEETDQFDGICVKNADSATAQTLHAEALEVDTSTDKLDKPKQTSSDFELEETSKEKWQPRGILKRCVRRCFSESHATSSQATMDNLAWSNSIFDAISDPIPEDSMSSTSSEDSKMADDGVANTKSVRFNEVVQRQFFRSNSSILGQKRRNAKKNDLKLRKRGGRENMAVERRASEGDAESLLDAGFKLSSSFERSILRKDGNNGYSSSENGSVSPTKNSTFPKFSGKPENNLKLSNIQFDDSESHTDSGVASSYDEHATNSPPEIKNMEKITEEYPKEDSNVADNETFSKPNKKSKKNKKNKLARGKSQQQGHFIKETNSDLIFDLDF